MAIHHIMIVEDQRDLARMLMAGLKSLSLDYQAISVPSGEEALLVTRSQTIDLVVIDVLLPGMSGLTLLERLKQRQPEIKAILITGAEDHGIRRQVANAGAEAFFFKPVEFADLVDAIRRCLDPQPIPHPPLALGEIEHEEATEAEDEVDTVSNRLSALRQELKALSVVLLNDRGQPMVQAGEFPESVKKENLIPALMAVFSAGIKVAHAVGTPAPEDLFAFRGQDYLIHMTHVGQSYALLILSAYTPDPEAFMRVAAVIPDVAPELLNSLANMGVPVETGPLPAEPEPEPLPAGDDGELLQALPDLDEIFQQAAETQLSPEEVDAFWAPPAKSIDTGSLHADDLTYDQAHKLGLAPDEEEP